MTTTMAEILSKDKQQEEEPPLPLKPQGSKVFSKLFSRESSAAAPSFRVYYGVASAGSVPFLWESQPGTPKNDAISAAALPPLTPPPSYYTAAKQATHHKSPAAAAAVATTGGSGKNKQCKHSGFLSAILPKIILHHRRSRSSSSSPTASSASSASSAFSSASSSSGSSSLSFRSAQSPASSSMRSRVFAFSAAEDSEEEQAPATCFSVRHESFRAFKTCRVATTVRTALASVGAGHGTTAQRV